MTQALPLFEAFGKGVSCTDLKSLVPSTRKKPLPNALQPTPTAQAAPINAAQSLKAGQHDEMEAIGQAIPDLLRAFWAETDQVEQAHATLDELRDPPHENRTRSLAPRRAG